MKRTEHRNRKPVVTFLKAERIRQRVAAGEKQSDLAIEFGVLPSEVSQIVARKRFGEDIEAHRIRRRVEQAERQYEAAHDEYNEFRAQRNREQAEIDRVHPSRVEQ